MALELDYALVDVFAENALEGNMLAIFTDARSLTTEQMQALARETNLAETTFILPAGEEEADHEREALEGVRVRIFTTKEELQFAGHPTLGTASWLSWHHPTLRGAATIALRLDAGRIPVQFETGAAGPGVIGTMQQIDPVFGDVHALDEVAEALGVERDDLDATRPIQTVSTGMSFCIVPFRSVDALGRLACSPKVAQAWLNGCDAKFFYYLAPQAASAGAAGSADFRARMQFYHGEDPATGSAAGCAIAYLVEHGLVASGVPTVIEQGIEIARPSRLFVRASKTAGKVHDVFVGGRTISVATGRFFLP